MQFIQSQPRYIGGQPRQQTYFATLEDQVSADNPVRLIDAFIDKLDLQQLGFQKTVHHSEGRPPFSMVGVPRPVTRICSTSPSSPLLAYPCHLQ